MNNGNNNSLDYIRECLKHAGIDESWLQYDEIFNVAEKALDFVRAFNKVRPEFQQIVFIVAMACVAYEKERP